MSKRLKITPNKVIARIKTAQDLALPHSNSKNYCDTDCLETLLRGKMELQGLMPWSSNYTFLADLIGSNDQKLLGIYKPGDGERPLWDFPERSLSKREFASYLISQALGWPNIPTTVLRNGPHGFGTVQLFIEADYEAHYFNLRDMHTFTDDFRQMALFDYIANNADRKAGHCLKSTDGTIWAIDHGLTFHVDLKLRTVIWEFCDQAIADSLLADLDHFHALLHNAELCAILDDLLTPRELEALKKRVSTLVSTRQFPTARLGRNVPYPPI